MSATTAIPPAVAGRADARRQFNVWAQLPDDRALTERQLEEAIGDVAGLHPGDTAGASARRIELLISGAVTVTDSVGGRLYRRSDTFPEHPDNSPGSESYSRTLKELGEEEHRAVEQAREAAMKNPASPQAIARRELDTRIEERLDELLPARLDELLTQRLGEIRRAEQVGESRERLTKSTQTDAA